MAYNIEWREVVSADPTLVSHAALPVDTASATWTTSFLNEPGGDLLLFSVHLREIETVTNVTFGGVTAEQIASSESSWPVVAVYGIKAANQPAEGSSHDVVVSCSGSTTGALTVTKLRNVDPSVLANPLTDITAVTLDDNSTSTSIDIVGSGTEPSMIFSALTHREGCPPVFSNLDDVLSATCFQSPRGYGVSLGYAAVPTEYSGTWSFGDGRRRAVTLSILRDPNTLLETPTVVNGITDEFYDVAGLDPETEYEFRVKEDDGVNQSEWSDWYQFTTAPFNSGVSGVLFSTASSSDAWAVVCQSSVNMSATAVASDGHSAIATVNTSIIAAAQASDSAGDQPVAFGRLSQSATGNDTLDALANAAAAVSAGAAAGESWTVQAQVVVNMLEQGAAADQIQRQTDTAINAALTEQSAASDQFLASINYIAGLADTATANDAYMAVVSQLGSIASGAIASDSFGLTFGNALGFQSGALSSDAWLLMASVSAALFEACTADDLLQARASVTNSVTAGAIATARFAIVNAGIRYLVMGSIILRDALNYRVTQKPALNQSVKIKPGH